MADPIKPPLPGSTTPPLPSSSPSGIISLKPSGPTPSLKATEGTASPLTPDIKIPPNLPTGEVNPHTKDFGVGVKLPVFPKPSMPSSSFQASQPLKPPPLSPPPVNRPPLMPFAPATGVKPPIPPPLTSQPGQPPTVFKSSIRTMQDDLAALRKGEPPASFKIEKESEREARPIPQAVSPKITPPLPISHVELGKLEKAKPIAVEAQKSQEAQKILIPPSKPPFSLSKSTISVLPVGSLFDRFRKRPDFKRIILYAIVGIVGFGITAYLIPYLSSLSTVSVSPTPTTTPTRTPIATPISIENLFSTVDTIGISLGPDFTARFIDSVKTETLLSSKEPGIYRITGIDGVNQYGFSEFFNGASITVPDEIEPLIDENSFWLTLTYKSDNVIGFGLIAKLLNSNMANETKTAMQNWENTMTQALTNLFQFDLTKAASTGFLDNTYSGAAVRYTNFPDPNSTIDYSIVQAKNGESYLVVVNSREHIYGIIDKLK